MSNDIFKSIQMSMPLPWFPEMNNLLLMISFSNKKNKNKNNIKKIKIIKTKIIILVSQKYKFIWIKKCHDLIIIF